MTREEYLGKWLQVIDKGELNNVLGIMATEYKHKNICPAQHNVFRAFNLCPLDTLRVVMLGQDPYPQEKVATGIAFANTADIVEKNLSPSLKVIKECVINYERPHNSITFDQTLESWEKQGVLMLNSALTVEQDKIGSHTGLWKRFIQKLLKNLSASRTGIVYVLFGEQAQGFEKFIRTDFNHILRVKHPAFFARTHTKMPDIFKEVNDLLVGMNGYGIEWYKEDSI